MAKDELPRELLWLLDAPMFIDEKQVDAFYDAVVRPDYEGTSITLAETLSKTTTFGGGVTVGAALPWLLKGEAEARGELERGREQGQQRTLTPVSNAYRHLLALALHYATTDGFDDRLILADAKARTARTAAGREPGEAFWSNDDFITASPRLLVFLDLPPGTKLIPTALELTSGAIVQLFENLAEALIKPASTTAPDYPGSKSSREERNAYWEWFSRKFDEPDSNADRKALQVVERAVASSSIGWIDYRTPVGNGEPPFLHLHIVPRGLHHTGVFAYNLISRGFKHGIRLVGTLKSEPDMNVLAIFER